MSSEICDEQAAEWSESVRLHAYAVWQFLISSDYVSKKNCNVLAGYL